MITKENIIKHELIGLLVQIVDSHQPDLVGMEGRVVDESMKTLVIDGGKGPKRIPKAGTTFHFQVDGGVRVAGERIAHRPEDRTKKAR